MRRDRVVLVDKKDTVLGTMEKMEAHRLGELHRAFSVFIFNKQGQMLIHQRAADKYHGAGLWTNACCSHPQLDEDVNEAAAERLQYEMGLACDLHLEFSFIYRGAVENALIEHELDHVFIGQTDTQPNPNAAEVADFRWVDPAELTAWMEQSPDAFTIWFCEALPRVLDALRENLGGRPRQDDERNGN